MTVDHLRAGKMRVLEDISIGLESVPSAFVGLFHGRVAIRLDSSALRPCPTFAIFRFASTSTCQMGTFNVDGLAGLPLFEICKPKKDEKVLDQLEIWFLSVDYMHLYPVFISTTVDHLRAGKMHVLEDISIGLESVPSAFVGLFHGYNIGKKIVKVLNDFEDN
ncbi:hypothetical protein QVD17_03290 [Tagetes erecta]|uniref:Uncharacterized protein n=1 Tax=Tagetes erecta TaxID=13708 RepID=A0AAD8LB12_TARER|nr:hypothetical protein QVD17_03290 [Tagetes erecta]